MAILDNLVGRVDYLVIGGGMANTFLAAKGVNVGKSLQEPDLHETALKIMKNRARQGLPTSLPVDAVTAKEFKANAKTQHLRAFRRRFGRHDPRHRLAHLAAISNGGERLVDGRLERPPRRVRIPPFETGTFAAARASDDAQPDGQADLGCRRRRHRRGARAGRRSEGFTYISTAGGAFLEWLEGKALPGVEALKNSK